MDWPAVKLAWSAVESSDKQSMARSYEKFDFWALECPLGDGDLRPIMLNFELGEGMEANQTVPKSKRLLENPEKPEETGEKGSLGDIKNDIIQKRELKYLYLNNYAMEAADLALILDSCPFLKVIKVFNSEILDSNGAMSALANSFKKLELVSLVWSKLRTSVENGVQFVEALKLVPKVEVLGDCGFPPEHYGAVGSEGSNVQSLTLSGGSVGHAIGELWKHGIPLVPQNKTLQELFITRIHLGYFWGREEFDVSNCLDTMITSCTALRTLWLDLPSKEDAIRVANVTKTHPTLESLAVILIERGDAKQSDFDLKDKSWDEVRENLSAMLSYTNKGKTINNLIFLVRKMKRIDGDRHPFYVSLVQGHVASALKINKLGRLVPRGKWPLKDAPLFGIYPNTEWPSRWAPMKGLIPNPPVMEVENFQNWANAVIAAVDDGEDGDINIVYHFVRSHPSFLKQVPGFKPHHGLKRPGSPPIRPLKHARPSGNSIAP